MRNKVKPFLRVRQGGLNSFGIPPFRSGQHALVGCGWIGSQQMRKGSLKPRRGTPGLCNVAAGPPTLGDLADVGVGRTKSSAVRDDMCPAQDVRVCARQNRNGCVTGHNRGRLCSAPGRLCDAKVSGFFTLLSVLFSEIGLGGSPPGRGCDIGTRVNTVNKGFTDCAF